MVREFNADGAVVVVEKDWGDSEGGVRAGVGVWDGSCDRNELELEDAEGEEDRGDVVDEEVSNDDVSYGDGLDSEEVEKDDDDDVGGLYI